MKLSDIEIKMHNNTALLKLTKGKERKLSMSHTSKYAIAFVMINETV